MLFYLAVWMAFLLKTEPNRAVNTPNIELVQSIFNVVAILNTPSLSNSQQLYLIKISMFQQTLAVEAYRKG